MKSEIGVLLLAALSPFAIGAQQARPGNLSPQYLNDMPLVEHVSREITASDPIDAVARRMGAFQQLQDIVEELSDGRTAIGTATPDENRILQEYRDAYYAEQSTVVKNPADEALVPRLRRFNEDPALREEIFTKLFPPALQAQSRERSRVLTARRAALRPQEAFGGAAIVPTTAPPAAAPPAAAPPAAAPPPAAPPAPDALLEALLGALAPSPASGSPSPAPSSQPAAPHESIERARAAGVDTTVFGLQLGEPLELTPCVGLAPANHCLALGPFERIVSAVASAFGVRLMEVWLPLGMCPAWLSSCTISATVDDAQRLVAVVTYPAGYPVEQDVARDLRAKYGRWSKAIEHFIETSHGGPQVRTLDTEWVLPGLHVEYKVVDGQDRNKGSLRIETVKE